jgi:hypothetical protein
MKPLQSAAMGFVFVALYARFHGYDAYADPFGWLLVLLGVRRLPAATPLRPAMLATGAVTLAVSVPLWLPAVRDRLADLDASLAWAADLPAFAFLAVLCHGLAEAADQGDDERAARWLRLVRTVVGVVALLPVVVFGAGVDALASSAAFAAQALYVALVWLMFAYSGRAWAGAPRGVESAADRA